MTSLNGDDVKLSEMCSSFIVLACYCLPSLRSTIKPNEEPTVRHRGKEGSGRKEMNNEEEKRKKTESTTQSIEENT